MKTRFIYLLETTRKHSKKKNRNQKISMTDGLEHQSRIHELVRPNNFLEWICDSCFSSFPFTAYAIISSGYDA